MNTVAGTRRGVGPGRLDPTVRALLRAFLSPAVADRYTSALQPIAVADRDAAIAGAVSTLRARYYVLAEEIAAVLVEDTGWTVPDVATFLGMPATEVRAALTLSAAPRVGVAPPPDLGPAEDEAAMVEALVEAVPPTGRGGAGVAPPTDDAVTTELATELPAHAGLTSLDERIRRADRRQRRLVNLTIVAIAVLVGLTVDATRQPPGEVTLPTDVTIVDEPGATPGDEPASPTAEPSPEEPTSDPTAGTPDVPVGPVTVAEARFVASVDPATGEPGEPLTTFTIGQDPRLWLRLEQLPRRDLVLDLVFTEPGGEQTVRPVLVTDRVPLISVRLPDELGLVSGRYGAAVRVDGSTVATAEISYVPNP